MLCLREPPIAGVCAPFSCFLSPPVFVADKSVGVVESMDKSFCSSGRDPVYLNNYFSLEPAALPLSLFSLITWL